MNNYSNILYHSIANTLLSVVKIFLIYNFQLYFKQLSTSVSTAYDHEVKFHEIIICLFHEIKLTIMRLIFALFMRSNLSIKFTILISRLTHRSGGRHSKKHY
jgi:hypothetical protein